MIKREAEYNLANKMAGLSPAHISDGYLKIVRCSGPVPQLLQLQATAKGGIIYLPKFIWSGRACTHDCNSCSDFTFRMIQKYVFLRKKFRRSLNGRLSGGWRGTAAGD